MKGKEWICLWILLLGMATAGLAQGVKNEVEVSISKAQMPESSLQLLAAVLPEAHKVRFYRERDGTQVSYESKLKWRSKHYSIEFHEDGSLMDIEQLVPFRSLPDTVRGRIEEQFKKEFGHYKVRRVQVQFSAEDAGQRDAEVMKEFMERDKDNLTVRYELEVDGRTSRSIGAYEFLFDATGNQVKRRPIIRRSLDNILY